MHRLIFIALLVGTLPYYRLAPRQRFHHYPQARNKPSALQGLDRLAEGRAVSDIVVRHLNVGKKTWVYP